VADKPLAHPARHHGGVGLDAGAATAMVLKAGAFGADQRLVAFMQYLRVILVVDWRRPTSPGSGSTRPGWRRGGDMGSGARAPVRRRHRRRLARRRAGRRGAAAALALFPRHHDPGIALHLGFDVDFQLPQWLLGGEATP